MKKLLVVLLATSVFSSSTFAATFSDVPENHPQYTAIEWAAASGIVQGYEDNTFQPDRVLSKAEGLKVILVYAGVEITEEGQINFPDVKSEDWFYQIVKTAFRRQIVNGEGDGTFKPHTELTRAPFLKMLLITAGVDTSQQANKEHSYDVQPQDWYAQYLGWAKETNITPLDLDYKLYPAKQITRGEAVEALLKLARIQHPESGEIQKNLSIAESNLVATLVHLHQNQPDKALATSQRAIDFSQYAMDQDPEATISSAANKIARGFKKLTESYQAGLNQDYQKLTDSVAEAKQYAQEAIEIEPGTRALADKIIQKADELLAQIPTQ